MATLIEHASPTSMRILMIAPVFPPTDGVGSIRTGKTAKHLVERGHAVRVLAAHNPHFAQNLRVEVPGSDVIYIPYVDLLAPSRIVQGGRAKQLEKSSRPPSTARRVLRNAWRLCRAFTNFPDAYALWYFPAVRAGRRICESFKPDLILSSSPPFTAHVVARKLAKDLKVPWIPDFRDPWASNHHTSQYPALRKSLERWFERRVLRTASGLVTAAPEYTKGILDRIPLPALTMTNAFDPEDFPRQSTRRSDPALLSILYAGTMFPGNQSAEKLFLALAEMGAEANAVRIEFVGRGFGDAVSEARRAEVSHLLSVHGLVPQNEALAQQMGADVLLLLAWEDASFPGVIPAKVFSYLGARRPILVIGPRGNPLGNMVEGLGAGRSAHTVEQVIDYVRLWLEEKKLTGSVAWLGSSEVEQHARASKVASLEAFLHDALEREAMKVPA